MPTDICSKVSEYTRVFVDDEDWRDTGVVGDVLWNDLLPGKLLYLPQQEPSSERLNENNSWRRLRTDSISTEIQFA